nr:YetF domain-containing protein [Kineococcus aurantiacus]
MGDLVQQAVTQQDYSLTAGVLVIGVFTLLTLLLSWVNVRFPGLRKVVHGTPVLVVRDGEPLLDVLHRERMSLDDLRAAARQQGIRRFSEVDVAVLETDGQVSFLRAG